MESKEYELKGFLTEPSALLKQIANDFDLPLSSVEETSELLVFANSIFQEGTRHLESEKITEIEMKRLEKNISELKVKKGISDRQRPTEVRDALAHWIVKKGHHIPFLTTRSEFLLVKSSEVQMIVTQLNKFINNESLSNLIQKIIECRKKLDELIISNINHAKNEATQQIKESNTQTSKDLEEENKRHNSNLHQIEALRDIYHNLRIEVKESLKKNSEEKNESDHFMAHVDQKEYTLLVAKVIVAPSDTEFIELKMYYNTQLHNICGEIIAHSAGLPMSIVVSSDKIIGAGRVESENDLLAYSDPKNWQLSGVTIYFKNK